MNRLILLFMLLLVLFGCASTTVIKTLPDGAKVKRGGELLGHTPYEYWDRSLSFTTQTFTLQLEEYKDKEITIQKDQFFFSRILFPPVLALPWLFGYKELYYFELENKYAPGCSGLRTYQCWVKKLKEMPSHNAKVEDISMLLGVPPTRCEQVKSEQPIIKAEQCYWDLQEGKNAQTLGSAYINQWGGEAKSQGSSHQQFFRASCRINDGFVAECASSWQE
jgi:hypothetical protein